MSQADREWTTEEIRAEAERLAAAERQQFCRDEPEIDDPELWPVLDQCAIHPGLISDFIRSATVNSEADPAAVLGTLVTRLSVEVGRNPSMMIGDGIQHVNLLSGICGPTGIARKGTSAKPVERLFALGNQNYIPARTTPGPLSSGEGLIFAVHDPIEKWEVDKKSGTGQWVTVDPGIEDKRLFVLTEELSSALQAMAREGNTLSSIVRQIFDSGNLEPLTKSSRIKATGAHIGVIGHITIFELNQLLKESEIHNGLVNRFLWFCARRQQIIPFPEPIPDNDLIVFQSEIRDIVAFANRTERISFSADGREVWGEFYPELSESKGGFIGAVLERAPALVLRLAMIFCLVDRTSKITEAQLKTAIMLWRYCEQSARYIFGDKVVRNPLSKKILDMLGQCERLSLTEISNKLDRNFDSSAIKIAIKDLLERNKISAEIIKTPGRPTTFYMVVK